MSRLLGEDAYKAARKQTKRKLSTMREVILETVRESTGLQDITRVSKKTAKVAKKKAS